MYIHIYMCPPSYHHSVFDATNTLGHMSMDKCMSCHRATVVISDRRHFFYDYMYIMPIFFQQDLSPLHTYDQLYIYIYVCVCVCFCFHIESKPGWD